MLLRSDRGAGWVDLVLAERAPERGPRHSSASVAAGGDIGGDGGEGEDGGSAKAAMYAASRACVRVQ